MAAGRRAGTGGEAGPRRRGRPGGSGRVSGSHCVPAAGSLRLLRKEDGGVSQRAGACRWCERACGELRRHGPRYMYISISF